jgi:hypothetical protein
MESLKVFANGHIDRIASKDSTGQLAQLVLDNYPDIQQWLLFFKDGLHEIVYNGHNREESAQLALVMICTCIVSLGSISIVKRVLVADEHMYAVVVALWLEHDPIAIAHIPTNAPAPTMALKLFLEEADSSVCQRRLRRIQAPSLSGIATAVLPRLLVLLDKPPEFLKLGPRYGSIVTTFTRYEPLHRAMLENKGVATATKVLRMSLGDLQQLSSTNTTESVFRREQLPRAQICHHMIHFILQALQAPNAIEYARQGARAGLAVAMAGTGSIEQILDRFSRITGKDTLLNAFMYMNSSAISKFIQLTLHRRVIDPILDSWDSSPKHMLEDCMSPGKRMPVHWRLFRHRVIERGIYRCLFKKGQLRARCSHVSTMIRYEVPHVMTMISVWKQCRSKPRNDVVGAEIPCTVQEHARKRNGRKIRIVIDSSAQNYGD